MCGIVACRRERDATEYLLDGLRKLEYRGYDSAGIAISGPTGLHVHRVVGRLDVLDATLRHATRGVRERDAPGTGIGHTRWATHGRVTQHNAHPHLDCAGTTAVVHNGIIDNAYELRSELEARGHRFASDVDTEVVAHLVEEARRAGQRLSDAVRHAVRRLRGSWALAVTAADQPVVVVTRRRSPLLVGEAADGLLAASDVTALLGHASRIYALRDGDVVELDRGLQWSDERGQPIRSPEPIPIGWTPNDVALDGRQDFMEKEIAEQPSVAARVVEQYLPAVSSGRLWRELAFGRTELVRFVACGTSLHAAATAARALQQLAGLPARLVIASEHEDEPPAERVLTLAYSQSGETADVLRAVEEVDGPVVAITNTPHSTLARAADVVLDCRAGPEIGVAATKTFTAQVLVGACVALSAAAGPRARGARSIEPWLERISRVPDRIELAHQLADPVAEALAPDLAAAPGFLFVSRGAGLPYAAEGALKLKELTYRWAEHHPAGELKHGPLALIEDGLPVVVIDGGFAPKLRANVAEMQARGARILWIGEGRDSTFPIAGGASADPWGPLDAALALQHLARALARDLGHDVDKPRNLAKSVTVE